MGDEAPFGGKVLIADTSARARASHPLVRDLWATALRGRQIATCSIVTLELLYSARDAQEFTTIEAEQALLRDTYAETQLAPEHYGFPIFYELLDAARKSGWLTPTPEINNLSEGPAQSLDPGFTV